MIRDKSQQLTREPSECVCRMGGPSGFNLTSSPLTPITALILFNHSALSTALSAFNTTAL
ncbi:hypothetical protein HanRHA438_Chr06g0279021 [Helianthus annuus]|nr:hypothetical protein HanRHA438_Chr06g0279021 [Helianthus annuus]